MWPVPQTFVWDSDLAKWIEGACYFLESHYDEEIDAAVRYMVDTIRSAQQEDGYLKSPLYSGRSQGAMVQRQGYARVI